MKAADRLALLMEEHGEGRIEDMEVDLVNPRRFVLLQLTWDGEPWWTMGNTLQELADYIAQEEGDDWTPYGAYDLFTGEEYDPVVKVSFEPTGVVIDA